MLAGRQDEIQAIYERIEAKARGMGGDRKRDPEHVVYEAILQFLLAVDRTCRIRHTGFYAK